MTRQRQSFENGASISMNQAFKYTYRLPYCVLELLFVGLPHESHLNVVLPDHCFHLVFPLLFKLAHFCKAQTRKKGRLWPLVELDSHEDE